MNNLKSGFYFLLLASCFLFLVNMSACGRRGDPVLTAPYDEKAVEREAQAEETKKSSTDEADTGPEVTGTAQPDAPAGLVAVYTGNSIVIAWDEITDQEVKQYKVYRSEGDDYLFIGYSVTPAYTDNDIEPDREYYYKITAAGRSEGPASKELKVITKDN